MARTYRVAVHTGCGKSLFDCTCDGSCATTGKVVTANDSRDVEPLVEAARQFVKPQSPAEFLSQSQEEISAQYATCRRCLDALFSTAGEGE